jgi:hypothetical protein
MSLRLDRGPLPSATIHRIVYAKGGRKRRAAHLKVVLGWQFGKRASLTCRELMIAQLSLKWVFVIGHLQAILSKDEGSRRRDRRPSGVVRLPQVGKFWKQVAVRPDLVLHHLPVCEDSHKGITGVIGERAATARTARVGS